MITLRTLATGMSMVGLFAVGSLNVALAQPGSTPLGAVGFTLTFDEYGNSLLNGGPNPNPVVQVAGGGLQYYLPLPVTPGQVLVTNPVDITTANPLGMTDLLTFSNQVLASGVTVGVMLFESLIDDADDNAPADVPALNFLQPIITINEVGPEGKNGFTWVPFPPNAAGAVYIGISDGTLIPEPSTFILGGIGLAGLGVLAWRRRRAAG
jgi:hypothetical protein